MEGKFLPPPPAIPALMYPQASIQTFYTLFTALEQCQDAPSLRPVTGITNQCPKRTGWEKMLGWDLRFTAAPDGFRDNTAGRGMLNLR